MSKRKLLVFDSPDYATPFKGVFDVVFADTKKSLVDGIKECDAVLFTGGSDVSPHLYQEPQGKYTTPYPERDKFEQFVWNMAREHNKPTLGICRGLQFGAVMSGGKLIQHTNGHAGGSHMIRDIFGNNLFMTSLHHQMVRPETIEGSVLVATSSGQLSHTYLDGFDKEIYGERPQSDFVPEAEIVWIDKTRHLGIQGHPEMSNNGSLHKYCCQLVNFYMFDDKAVPPKYDPLDY